MNSTERPLSGFEERLLTELRRVVVVERQVLGVREPEPPGSVRMVAPGRDGGRRRRRARSGLGGRGAAARRRGGCSARLRRHAERRRNGDGRDQLASRRRRPGERASRGRSPGRGAVPAARQGVQGADVRAGEGLTWQRAGREQRLVDRQRAGSLHDRHGHDRGRPDAVVTTQQLPVPNDAPTVESTWQSPAQGPSSIAIAWAEGAVGECELVDAKDGVQGPIDSAPSVGGRRPAGGGAGIQTSGNAP